MAEAKKSKTKFGSVHPATVTVWAALIAVSGLLPSIPLLGTGGTMSVSTSLLPLAGILFGPIAGTLAAAIGGFIGQLIAPATAIFGIWTFLVGTVNALVAGLFWQGKWYYSIGISILTILLWISHPIGGAVPIFVIMFHGSGLLTAIFCVTLGKRWLADKNVLLKTIAVFLMSYSSIVIAACCANYGALLVWQMPPITWKMLAFTAPIERIAFSVAGTVIGVPLLVGLPKVGIIVGPQMLEADEDDEPGEETAAE